MYNAITMNTVMARVTKPALHVIASGLATLLLAPAVWSASLTIADEPLFLSTSVTPNVFFELDDSGSMDWEILTVKHWHFCDYDRDAPNDNWGFTGDTCTSSLRDNGLWSTYTGATSPGDDDLEDFEYIFVNSDNSYSQGCSSNRQTLYSCGTDLATNPPYQHDWRILSSDFNVLYYDPKEKYEPWQGPCLTDGSPCAAASFSAAKSDPRQGKAGYTVTTNLDGFTYEVWVDTAGYSGSQPERGGDINYIDTANNAIDLWDTHIQFTISGSTIIAKTTKYAPTSSGLNPTITTNILSGGEAALGGLTVAEVKTNVANWYQYSRKRSFVAKAGISAVVDLKPEFRYGLDTINQSSAFVEAPAALSNNQTHNDALLASLYDTVWPGSGTPLRQGLERAGEYYAGNLTGKASPILDSCQKNYTILMTDGYWNGSDPSVSDADGDGYDNSVADVAKYYHNTDLNTSLANDVPDDKCDPGNIRCDTEKRQHMVTYTLAFGVKGNKVDTDGNDWPDPLLAESDDWGDPYNADSPEKIDDLWHAAWNSYGKYINVSTPGEAVDGLTEAIADVSNRQGSASSVALNAGFISADTRIYQALFDAFDWSGDLKSFPVLTGGVIGTAVISANDQLPAYGSRTMLTHDGSDGVAFQWPALSASQQALLDASAAATDTTNIYVDYLRGDQTNEYDAVNNPAGVFRKRTSGKLLGDIINSAPAFAGAPNARYPDNWAGTSPPENCSLCEKYSTFKFNRSNRTPMVYVGTNAGYLSGFDADTLVEKIAYVPATVFRNLDALTNTNYTHQYYVDGSPTIEDAYFQGDNKWHTVLVSGLNNGGQGVFALDITDPGGFSETGTAPAKVVLWEFNDADDADMGYSYSQPAIVRMQNGQWAAVFGNGYNNRDADGSRNDDTVTGGNAYLYIVNIEDGSLIRKIDTGVGTNSTPNGLATPAVIDTNGDFIADAIYAGDLNGNMWKFDVSSTDPALWDVAFYNTAVPPVAEPLYIAMDSSGNRQPITTRPDVSRGPNGLYVMVFFGTGRYLGSPDLTDTSTQTFYGILDSGSRFTGRTDLVEQTVTYQDSNYRVTSTNPQTTTSRGWYLDLPDTGERTVANPLLRAGRIIFVTTIPDSNICSAGGDSWLMELNALTGSKLNVTPFDLNNDALFSLEDYIDTDGDGTKDTAVAGVKFDELIPTPGILPDEDTEYKYTSDSSGNLDVTVENPGPRNVGRQSWGQLR